MSAKLESKKIGGLFPALALGLYMCSRSALLRFALCSAYPPILPASTNLMQVLINVCFFTGIAG